MANTFKITLTRGASYTTPWGRKVRAGVPLILPETSQHISYFSQSPRFEVAALNPVAEQRKAEKTSRKAALNERRKTKRGAAAPEQLEAKAPKKVAAPKPSPPEVPDSLPAAPSEPSPVEGLDGLSRSRLMSKAKGLGLSVRPSDTKAAIRSSIEVFIGKQDGGHQPNASSEAS